MPAATKTHSRLSPCDSAQYTERDACRMNELKLKILTRIHSDDYDDCIETGYDCRYSCDGGVYRLKYSDDENGFTVIKISDGEISIRRQNSSVLILREGYTHTSDYITPYGNIPMECAARQIKVDLGESGGRIEYVADLIIGGAEQTNTVVMVLETLN